MYCFNVTAYNWVLSCPFSLPEDMLFKAVTPRNRQGHARAMGQALSRAETSYMSRDLVTLIICVFIKRICWKNCEVKITSLYSQIKVWLNHANKISKKKLRKKIWPNILRSVFSYVWTACEKKTRLSTTLSERGAKSAFCPRRIRLLINDYTCYLLPVGKNLHSDLKSSINKKWRHISASWPTTV